MDDESPGPNDLLSLINDYYQDLLGYKPEKTRLLQISDSEWEGFTQQRGLNSNWLLVSLFYFL